MWVALAILAVLAAMIFAAYRWGGKGERANSQADKLDAIKDAKDATDAVKRDPDYADRVRSEYQRD